MYYGNKEIDMIVGVLLPLPFNEPFDYKTDGQVELGNIVKVPFGKDISTPIRYLTFPRKRARRWCSTPIQR